MIAIVDYGLGNLGSVTKAFRRFGAETVLTDDAAILRKADALVMPGDGAFAATMDEVRRRGLVPVLTAAAAAGTPVLGICIGMQILFDESEEHGRHLGLGLLPGRVRRFEAPLVVPHMGWNRLAPRAGHPLFDGIAAGSHVYFVHSYWCDAAGDDVIARSDYGAAFPAAVARGNVMGLQFHPEKSQSVGLRIVENFVRMCAGHSNSNALLAAKGTNENERRMGRGGSMTTMPATAALVVVPAVDVRGGKVVRLKQGQLQQEQVYGGNPADAARRWEQEGAARLHLVDLDAAFGARPQFDVIASVIEAVKIPVEIGGGLRVLENAMRYRERGAERVIFGTAAVASPGVVQEAVRLWGDAVAVAVDAKNGKVSVAGWQEVTTVAVSELIERVKGWGVRRVQYTDVVRDGTLVGPNVAGIEEVVRSGLKVTAGGGISTLDDLRKLKTLVAQGMDEAIVGKALYDKRFTLAEAQEAAR